MGETLTKAELLRALSDPRIKMSDPVMVRVVHKDRSDGTCGSFRGEHLPLSGGLGGWEDGSWTVVAEAGPTDLTFAEVRAVNEQRCARWHHPDTVPWTGADWSNAMQGEAGEAGNVVKKLRRLETRTGAAADLPAPVLIEKLAGEVADTFIYLDLLAAFYGIDLAAAVTAKFNAVSVREGFPDRLPPVWLPKAQRIGGE